MFGWAPGQRGLGLLRPSPNCWRLRLFNLNRLPPCLALHRRTILSLSISHFRLTPDVRLHRAQNNFVPGLFARRGKSSEAIHLKLHPQNFSSLASGLARPRLVNAVPLFLLLTVRIAQYLYRPFQSPRIKRAQLEQPWQIRQCEYYLFLLCPEYGIRSCRDLTLFPFPYRKTPIVKQTCSSKPALC